MLRLRKFINMSVPWPSAEITLSLNQAAETLAQLVCYGHTKRVYCS